MGLTTLSLTCNDAHAEEIADFLEAWALAITLEAGDEQEVFQLQPDDKPLWQHTRVQALFDDSFDLTPVLLSLHAQFSEYISDLNATAVIEQDWVRLTQRQFTPQCFGDTLWICPSWHDASELAGKVLHLDPGVAFGTGTHPTTALCLEWLCQQELHGKRVIDFGCGSGILALSAALLGAERVVAIDHDPQALEACTENAARNQLTQQLQISAEPPQQQADYVIANILAGPLLELRDLLCSLLKPGGTLVLSGLLNTEIDTLTDAYQATLQAAEVRQQNEWALLSFTATKKFP